MFRTIAIVSIAAVALSACGGTMTEADRQARDAGVVAFLTVALSTVATLAGAAVGAAIFKR